MAKRLPVVQQFSQAALARDVLGLQPSSDLLNKLFSWDINLESKQRGGGSSTETLSRTRFTLALRTCCWIPTQFVAGFLEQSPDRSVLQLPKGIASLRENPEPFSNL